MADGLREASAPPLDASDDMRGATPRLSVDVTIEVPPPHAPGWHEMTPLPNEVVRADDGDGDPAEALMYPGCDYCKDRTDSCLLPIRRYNMNVIDHKEIPRTVEVLGNQVLSGPPKCDPYRPKQWYCLGGLLAGLMYPPIVACVFVLIGYCHIRPTHVEEEKNDPVTLVPYCVTILGVCYAIVLLEFCLCETSRYVCVGTGERGAIEYTHSLRHAEPRLILRLRKYRKLLWKREEPGYIRRSTREIEITITRWKDFTPELNMSSMFVHGRVIKLRIHTAVCFMDEATSREYQTQLSNLQEDAAKNPKDVTHIDTFLKMPGYRSRLMVTQHYAESLLLRLLFLICGVCLLSWVYRRYFKLRTIHAHHRIMKVVGI